MPKSYVRTAIACAVLVSSPTLAHEKHQGSIGVKHPWVEAIAAGATQTSGYLKIENTGKAADRLIGASLAGAAKSLIVGPSPGATTGGGIDIPAGATVELKPGTLHLEFSGLAKSLTADDYVDGTLVFEKAGTMATEFYVEEMSEAAGSGSGK